MQPTNAEYAPTNIAEQDQGGYGAAPPAKPSARGSPSVMMIVLFVLIPWLTFAVVMSMESFTAHFYSDGAITPRLLFGGLALVLLLVLLAVLAGRGGQRKYACWQGFMAVMTLVALLLGIAIGGQNYADNMRPYYDIRNANEYHNVDPAQYTGVQMMDAGQIEFSEGSRVDVSRSMAFRNAEMYCVAPIVSGEASAVVESYDFWAVGTNCCDGDHDMFKCGEYNVAGARSGLRLMNDDQRSFYRLAVQQAEAAFNIPARHPLFFYWLQDAEAEIHAYENAGYAKYVVNVGVFFVAMLVAAALGASAYSKM